MKLTSVKFSLKGGCSKCVKDKDNRVFIAPTLYGTFYS